MQDWALYQRLCQPGSSNFIVDGASHYAFFTETLFHGQVGSGRVKSEG
ncbi:MAG: hypothetical protein WBB22_06925 [Anaerolineae bacterium]